MAEGNYIRFHDFVFQCMVGTHDLENDTIKAALLAGYVPDPVNHADWADVEPYEVGGTGYDVGGVAVDVTLSKDDITGKTNADGPDPHWDTLLAGAPSHIVFYNDTTADKNLICAYELGIQTNGGGFTTQVNAGGLFGLG